MKNLFLFLILTLIIGTASAQQGNIYLSNVNQYHGSENLIRFKNELYTSVIPPKNITVISSDQLGVEKGIIDYYIEDITKTSGFKKCVSDFPYHTTYLTRISGWYNDYDYGCDLLEDD